MKNTKKNTTWQRLTWLSSPDKQLAGCLKMKVYIMRHPGDRIWKFLYKSLPKCGSDWNFHDLLQDDYIHISSHIYVCEIQ